MIEDGKLTQAKPECKDDGPGWVYHGGACYLFSSYHVDFDVAIETCKQFPGAYLADALSADENNFLKTVLLAINPKDGTDYWLGGVKQEDGSMQWLSGKIFLT